MTNATGVPTFYNHAIFSSNVGIGVVTPTYKLEVAGSISASGIVVGSCTGCCGSSSGVTFYVDENGTNQTSLPVGTWTKVTWPHEVFDTNNNTDSTTNHRFTPTVAGKHQVHLQAAVDTTNLSPSAIFSSNAIAFSNFPTTALRRSAATRSPATAASRAGG